VLYVLVFLSELKIDVTLVGTRSIIINDGIITLKFGILSIIFRQWKFKSSITSNACQSLQECSQEWGIIDGHCVIGTT